MPAAAQRKSARTLVLYRALGRTIASDLALNSLPVAPEIGAAAVTMCNSGRSWQPSAPVGGELPQFVRERYLDGARYAARGIGEFLIQSGGTRVTYSLSPGAPPDDLQHILTGPALVIALQLQGQFVLHAAALEKDGAMFALSAPHGFGKSTLAASLLGAGCIVHSDDVVPLSERDGAIVGRQGQPWIKLWDDVLGEFGQDADAYDEVLEGFGKRVVPAITSSDQEVPLRGIFLLAPHLDADRPIAVVGLARLNAALAIMSNVHSPEIMSGTLAADTLDFAARIAERVPVRVISYYRSFGNLPAIREAILSDIQRLMHA